MPKKRSSPPKLRISWRPAIRWSQRRITGMAYSPRISGLALNLGWMRLLNSFSITSGTLSIRVGLTLAKAGSSTPGVGGFLR